MEISDIKTRQDVVDFVAKKMRIQGRRSCIPDGENCLYRSATGDKCAVGHLFTDEYYDPSMESHTPYGACVTRAMVGSGLQETLAVDSSFLRNLQFCHDHSSLDDFLPDFNRELQSLCASYGLQYPEEALAA